MGGVQSAVGVGRKKPKVQHESFFDYTFTDAETGREVSMREMEGNVVLVMNVASKWGLTAGSYSDLGELCQQFKDRPFRVVLFPCNQFLSQDPGRTSRSNVDKLTSSKADMEGQVYLSVKADVNGDGAHPVMQYLKYNSSLYSERCGRVAPLPWNFSKFLVEPKGGVFGYYGPRTTLQKMAPDIEQLLAAGPSAPGTKPRPATVRN